MRVFYSPAYVGAAHAFETTRKARWVADSLAARPIPGVELAAPQTLTDEQACAVHDPVYVRSVHTGQPRGLAQSQGFEWDGCLYPMVMSSNGGVLSAARAALADGIAGSLSSGLHHARYDRGAGYCTFNGLAIAARWCGARTVLVLDLDAHCGGGTYSLLGRDPGVRHVDVSVSSFDAYPPGGDHQLRIVTRAEDYLPAIDGALRALDQEGARFDLCLYNAGMDPFAGCAIGGLAGITREILAEREQRVFEWCRGRGLCVAFVLAGGYFGPGLDEAGLVELHRLTIAAAAAG